MARRGGRRGRRRGRRRSTRSKASSSKRRSTRRRSTAASRRRRVRSVAKAKRARNRTTKSTTKKKSRKPMGRSRHTKGGQHAANKNQNKKSRRTVKSVKKAVSKVAKNVSKAIGKATRGAASYAANHPSVSSYNRRTRDMSKLTPQQQRRYQRLSEKTGRDYSTRIPTMKINLSADRLAQFGGFADSGWYRGITSRFPGIRNLQINKQLYGNPMKKGWHYSQRTGRGQGVTDRRSEMGHFGLGIPGEMTPERAGLRADPSVDIRRMYQNILGRKYDQEGLDYWTEEVKSGRQSIDDVRKQFVRSDEFQGRSDADRSAALEGLKQRRNTRQAKTKIKSDHGVRRGVRKHAVPAHLSVLGSQLIRRKKKAARQMSTSEAAIARHKRSQMKPVGRGRRGRGKLLSIVGALAGMRGGV